jgi:hypothetical protein
MNTKLKIRFLIILITISTFTLGCETALQLKYRPLSNPDNLLVFVSPIKIRLLNLEDNRKGSPESTLVGERQMRVESQKLDVMSKRPVSEVIIDALSSELIKNGHSVVEDNEDLSIKGKIQTFWLKTAVTPGEWDVIGEIQVVLEVVNSGNGESTLLGPYSARNNEVRSMNPEITILDRVLSGTLSKLVKKISLDTNFASALAKK